MLARVVGRNNVVNTIWGSGFVLVGAACFVVARGIDSGDLLRQVLLMATVLVRGTRFSWYVGVRSAGKGEDAHYTELWAVLRSHRRPADEAVQVRPRHQGKIADIGLWSYTRHPNSFGDATVWFGIWLIAAEQWPGVLAVFGPLLMAGTSTPPGPAGWSRCRTGFSHGCTGEDGGRGRGPMKG